MNIGIMMLLALATVIPLQVPNRHENAHAQQPPGAAADRTRWVEAFDKIKAGMTLKEVTALLGSNYRAAGSASWSAWWPVTEQEFEGEVICIQFDVRLRKVVSKKWLP